MWTRLQECIFGRVPILLHVENQRKEMRGTHDGQDTALNSQVNVLLETRLFYFEFTGATINFGFL